MKNVTKSGFLFLIPREHRRWIVEKYRLYEEEIEFIDAQLAKDNKNYHAWAYRLWLCEAFDIFISEKIAIEKFFQEDIMNNSAWNYRHFLVSSRFMLTKEDQAKEIAWDLEKIKEKPDNEASWNYLMGWFPMFDFINGKKPKTQEKHLSLNDFPQIADFCFELFGKNENESNRFLYFFLLNYYLMTDKSENLAQNAVIKLQEIDPIRLNYYKFIENRMNGYFSLKEKGGEINKEEVKKQESQEEESKSFENKSN